MTQNRDGISTCRGEAHCCAFQVSWTTAEYSRFQEAVVSVQVVAQQVGRKRKKLFTPGLPTPNTSSSSSSWSSSPSSSDSHQYLGLILLWGDEIELINVYNVWCRHHSNHPVLKSANQVPHIQELPKLCLLLYNRERSLLLFLLNRATLKRHNEARQRLLGRSFFQNRCHLSLSGHIKLLGLVVGMCGCVYNG